MAMRGCWFRASLTARLGTIRTLCCGAGDLTCRTRSWCMIQPESSQTRALRRPQSGGMGEGPFGDVVDCPHQLLRPGARAVRRLRHVAAEGTRPRQAVEQPEHMPAHGGKGNAAAELAFYIREISLQRLLATCHGVGRA